ncbi:amidase [Microbulbifer hydrolyticus]|uniref:Amidase n=1 Tax=Microbulbifer hydrolyticus TaxID=48074 RepID=A0A6P1TCQ6_9GAMM|nr:amidase [Microbulbifer hydrolyticus]MBB5210132.1 aspartyl-tRNA(Asn)/glutamyl-tRNA(Gln) amidotransferase subunit A [Microbulbifer hydrolyticus]QHQ39350.1 amidase [Microbulbifer hydrolyticus]
MIQLSDSHLREDASSLAERLRRGEYTSEQLTARTLAAIEKTQRAINAYVFVDREGALAAARASDARRRAGALLSIYDGLSFAVKDNIAVAGMPTANGLGYRGDAPVSKLDAAVVAQLRSAGLIPLGKLNMHEIALGATNDNPHWGRCEHPLRAGFTPGGSSGGSAAAVSAGLCAVSLGTDTMGSVRIPASYCGVSGFKPGRGSVSANGVTRLSRQLDTVGPLARSSRDLCGLWPLLRETVCKESLGPADLASTRWAVVDDCLALGVAAEISADFQCFTAALPGAIKRPRTFAGSDFSAIRRAGLLLCEAEANVTFAQKLAQRPALFSEELQRLLRWGAERSAPDLVRAQDTVEAAGHWLRMQLDAVDYLLTPTTLQTAFPFSTAAPVNQANLTACVNMAGLAAASIPLGVSSDGLPFGVQIIARAGAEATLLETCVALEQWLPSQRKAQQEMA